MTDLMFPKIPKPELDKPGPRKALTREQVIILVIRQTDGTGVARCGCGCGDPLKPKCVDEHVVPRNSLRAEVADDLSNRALYNPECAKRKTVADQAVIAKGRRLRGERGSQYAKRKENGSRLKGNPKIANRGFDKSLRKKLSGEVVKV